MNIFITVKDHTGHLIRNFSYYLCRFSQQMARLTLVCIHIPLIHTVQGHLGVIRCTCLKMACFSKMADCRMKRTEIWDSSLRTLYLYGGTFNLSVLKVIVGSFGTLVSKWPVTEKGRNGPK